MPDNTVYDFFFRRMDAMTPLRRGLDAFALRQKVSASNLANAETPGYNAQKVEFESDLAKILDRSQSGLARSNEAHIPVMGGIKRMERLQPHVVDSDTPPLYNGVNNVDIDMEMADMATNQIHYSAASKVLGIRYKMLAGAIKGHV